jgi:Flp pilus assembly protein TadG
MTALRTFARDERGATVVEFALVTPVLILVLVVCFDFARALNAYVTVANASREGVRYASVIDLPTSIKVKNYLSTRVAPLDPSAMGVTLAPPVRTEDSWSPEAPAPTKFTVVVTYQWHASTWLVGSFFAGTSGSPTFASTSSTEAVR